MKISINFSENDDIDMSSIMPSLLELDPNLDIVSLCPITFKPRIQMIIDSINHEVFTLLKLSYGIEVKVLGNEV